MSPSFKISDENKKSKKVKKSVKKVLNGFNSGVDRLFLSLNSF